MTIINQFFSQDLQTMVGEKVKIALVVSAYFIISISMVFMNKFLLNRDDSIPAPFFITWYLL